MHLDISPAVAPKNAAWYAQHYYSVEDDIAKIFERFDTPFLDTKLHAGMKVFDAMMGRGRHALRYAQRGCNVWGNDLNPHMVEFAKKSAVQLKIPKECLKLTTGDATQLKDVPSAAFDATIAMFSSVGTIPGSKNRQKALREFARITKKGGLVIVHAHNRWDTFWKPSFLPWTIKTYTNPDKGLERGDIIIDYNGLEGMFNHFYSPREFRNSFAKVGLRVVEEHYYTYKPTKEVYGLWRKFRADGFIFVARAP